MDMIDANIVLYELYETKYGIYNHLNPYKKRPMASVALHEAEENTTNSSLYEAIEGYVKLNIKDLTGLTLTEYLDLPTEFCILLANIASKEAQKKSTILGNMEKDINSTK